MDLECVAIVLSIIAIIVSVIGIFQTKKVNTINLNSEHIKDIYKEFLTQKIPDSLRYLNYNDNHELSGEQKLQNTLLEFLKAIRYFEYLDEEFYIDIKMKIQRLEDYIIGSELQNYDVPKDFFYKNVKEMLVDIYNAVSNKYENG